MEVIRGPEWGCGLRVCGMWDFGGFRQGDALLDVHQVVPCGMSGWVRACKGAVAMPCMP